ncbi:DUF2683 family protein [Candidatus Micrarchaeota archaeon]|nr:DUF2683 family protein [Candidatus Micrarchaeota archaeon]
MAINLNLRNIDEYTNRVLGVIKEMYGLRDKGEALKWLAHKYGDEFIEPKLREEFVKSVIKTTEEHIKKYPKRRMTLKELRNI